MIKLNEIVLKKVLEAIGHENLWAKAYEGMANDNGIQHFRFNHFRSEINHPAITDHRDFNPITLLYSQDGLEAFVDGRWSTVSIKEDHFVVNLGIHLETLVNDRNKLTGIWHRVKQIKEGVERNTFALFSLPNSDLPVCSLQADGSLFAEYASYNEFKEECYREATSEDPMEYFLQKLAKKEIQ